MLHVVPRWRVEYGFGVVGEVDGSYTVNANHMSEVLEHFSKFNHGVKAPKWLQVVQEKEFQPTVTTGSFPGCA